MKELFLLGLAAFAIVEEHYDTSMADLVNCFNVGGLLFLSFNKALCFILVVLAGLNYWFSWWPLLVIEGLVVFMLTVLMTLIIVMKMQGQLR